MPSRFRMSISLLSWPSEIQWQRARQRSISLASFFLDRDHDNSCPGARAFERQQREAAVAGDEPVAFHRLLHDAPFGGADELEQFVRLRAARHFASDPLDGLRGVQLARVSRRRAVCRASMRSGSKPRRSSPMLLAPKTRSRGLVAGQ